MFDPLVFLRRLGMFAMIPIGVSLLLGAAWTVSSTRTWLAHAVEAEGKVIEMVRTRDRDDSTYLFAPVVRFQTAEGATVEFESTLRSYPPAYRTGETVTVFYDRYEPRHAKLKGFFSLWFMPFLLGFIGSIFLVVGTAMFVMSRWAARFFEPGAASFEAAVRPRAPSPSH
jgi:hypothetical protein